MCLDPGEKSGTGRRLKTTTQTREEKKKIPPRGEEREKRACTQSAHSGLVRLHESHKKKPQLAAEVLMLFIVLFFLRSAQTLFLALWVCCWHTHTWKKKSPSFCWCMIRSDFTGFLGGSWEGESSCKASNDAMIGQILLEKNKTTVCMCIGVTVIYHLSHTHTHTHPESPERDDAIGCGEEDGFFVRVRGWLGVRYETKGMDAEYKIRWDRMGK